MRIPQWRQSKLCSLVCTLIVLAVPVFGWQDARAQEDLQEPTLQEILESLGNENVDQRLWAVGDLQYFDLETKADRQLAVDALTKLLDDPSIKVRLESVKVLRYWEVPSLPMARIALDGLKAEDDRTRAEAIYLLGSLPTAADKIEQIEQALSDPEPYVQRAAASVLGDLGPDHKEKLIPVLTEALSDPDHGVRGQAAESLAKVDGPLDPAISTIVELIKEANVVYDDDFPVHLDIISAVEDLGIDARETIPSLIESLGQGGTHRQCSVANALAAMGPAAEPALVPLGVALRDGEAVGYPFVHQSWCVSDDAAKALVAIGDRSIPILIDALVDDHPRVRANAANALGDLPSSAERALPKLIELLTDGDPSVRSNAAWAMGKFGQDARTAIPELVAILFDDNEWSSAPAGGGIARTYSVPWHAVEAIARINPDDTELVKVLKAELTRRKTINFAVATVISKTGSQADPLIEELWPMLDDVKLRAPAAFAAAHIQSDARELLAVLTDSLVDDSGEIDRVAARGLLVLGERANPSIPDLYTAIIAAEKDEFVGRSSDMIYCALAILFADIQQDRAIDVLFKALSASHYAFDQTAIEEAIRRLPELAGKNAKIRERLNQQLDYQYEPDADTGQRVDEDRELIAHDLFVRLRAARILQDADLDSDKVITALTTLCRIGRYQVRGEAIELLGRYGPQADKVVGVLCGFLADEDIYTVGGDFYGNGGEQFTVAQKSIAALAAIGPAAINGLTRKLGDSNHRIRANAAKALGQMGDPASPALEAILSLAHDPSHYVRRNVAEALGVIGCDDPEIKQMMIDELNRLIDDRPSIQKEAIRSLNKILQ